jgi:hypothetical protein
MRANWIQVKKEKGTSWSHRMNVSLNARGHLMLNLAAWEKLGSPQAVKVLFDPTNMNIGLQAAQPNTKDVYTLVRTNKTSRVVRAFRLLAEHSIDVTDTLQFRDLEIDTDGILVLKLRMAAKSVRAASARKAKLADRMSV